ncbi:MULTISPECIES: FAD-dependent monooxygenase [unclassified Beijerinckia]|uniref:FAD-dependent oxidoreductase n=1 Tax=unclassified Beijerinckia TaxID=2638183 RepID=UPI0008961C6D|nr:MULTISPECIES: FAD-dependent monooxygenase [unclassified Beijerinckia]MDH7799134.1 3-(3-hydroxy-phenyl)propionate hydroxylase [Beijerinckia sp. GAS462]SED94005.1 3-(3-hydroxy-phenyl)propionate hydroxylase [Beijerinckia sp. 28-YEA-48]
MTSKQVVIIGAGPVGLSLALVLTKSGVPVTVIETLNESNFLDQVPRAGTNHPATLEMFDRIGLYEKIEPRGFRAPLFHYWDRGGPTLIAEFDHALLRNDTKFPYVLQCERIKICEEALALALEEPLCTVLMDTTFVSFTQDANGIVATAKTSDGDEIKVEGSYIVSAEGARSIVRRDLGIDFEGFTYPDRTLNIEVVHDFRQYGFADRNYISDPDEWSNLFRWAGPPERWRVHFPTNPDDDPEVITQPEALQARLQAFMPSSENYDIRGSNLYTVHQRVAASFRKGRAILAGDSAHVNSPIGGMGMNSGIHDAFNLADKLIAILQDHVDDDILDHYDRQRRQIAVSHTQAQTIRNKRLLQEKDPTIRQQNQDELKRTAGDPDLARKFLLRTSLLQSIRDAALIQ